MQGTLSIWWRGVFTGGEGWWNHWSIFTLPRFTLSGHFAVKLYWYSQTFTTAASTSDFICLLTDTPELYTTEERVIYNPASLYLDSLSIQCQFRTYQEQGKAEGCCAGVTGCCCHESSNFVPLRWCDTAACGALLSAPVTPRLVRAAAVRNTRPAPPPRVSRSLEIVTQELSYSVQHWTIHSHGELLCFLLLIRSVYISAWS